MVLKIFGFIQALLILFAYADSACAQEPKIGMLIQKEHTATYLETLEGFRTKLAGSGKRYKFVEKNAKNDRKTMAVIAKEFATDPTIQSVVVLGSAAATIANRHIKNKPVIFGGINHPEGLGISGDNITGATYYIAPATVVSLIRKLKPGVRKVGILYEPAEQNAASVVEVPETVIALKERGIGLVKEKVEKKEDIVNKTKRNIEAGAEYLIIPTNSLLYSNVSLIRSVSDAAGVPVVSFSRKGVANGGLIAITSNNWVLGGKMAQMLVDITEGGKSPQEIKWCFPDKFSIVVNETTRAELGVLVPRKIYGIATIL
jgi:putative ABC transport system substrate-binding protein